MILEVDQPKATHNGGETAFGLDGHLYVSFGDGSAGGDQFDNAQNLETLLGSISVHLEGEADVGRTEHPDRRRQPERWAGLYGIPPDNPFANNSQGYGEEIFAYGFRNPWKFSVDPRTGALWVADVGELKWEEIDYVTNGVMRFAPTPLGNGGGGESPPFSFVLQGPNPFSGITTFTLTTDRPGGVRVAAFDVLGREVNEVFNGFLSSGETREVAFDAANLASGIYFLRAERDGTAATRTVVLAR